MNRQTALTQWLNNTLKHDTLKHNVRLQKVADDASFRRYFRVFTQDKTFIVMDSPPDKEDNQTFVSVDQWLYKNGINVPRVIDYDLAQGFVLLTDFGNETMFRALNKGGELKGDVLNYYTQAIDALITLQKIPTEQTPLPHYSRDLLMQEMQLLTQWYIPHYKPQLSAAVHQQLTQLFSQLCDYMVDLPQCVVHRDYHSRNLMVVNQQPLGVLDFQDALIGAYSYDVVSLLKDVYFQLNPADYQTLLRYYHQQVCPHLSEDTVIENVDFSGVQRHLKILGIFTRLSKRDQKHQYLEDIPLVKHYLAQMVEKYHCFQCLESIL